jgi:hypothetical protein
LVPFSSQPSSVRAALVCTAARPDPAPCSLTPIAGYSLPAAIFRQQAAALFLGAVGE